MSCVKHKGRVSKPERVPLPATIGYSDSLAKLPPKKPPAASVPRGGAVTEAVWDINEVNTRARAAAQHGCDLVRCMGCGRLAELPISRRGRRLRCTRCGAAGLNISMIEPDSGQPAKRTTRKAAQ